MRADDDREQRRLVLRTLAERTGLVTLTANAGSTTLVDARIRHDSPVALLPVTTNAAAELVAGLLHVNEAGRVNGSVAIVHANNAQTDRTFRYLIA
jgi:hypothetical protein